MKAVLFVKGAFLCITHSTFLCGHVNVNGTHAWSMSGQCQYYLRVGTIQGNLVITFLDFYIWFSSKIMLDFSFGQLD